MAHAPGNSDEVKLAQHRGAGWKKKVGKQDNGQPQTFYFPKADGEAAAKTSAWARMKEWDVRLIAARRQGIDPAMVTWETALRDPDLNIDLENQQGVPATPVPRPKSAALPPKRIFGPTLANAITSYLAYRQKHIGLSMNVGIKSGTHEKDAFRLRRVCEFWTKGINQQRDPTASTVTHLCQLDRPIVRDCLMYWCGLPNAKLNVQAHKRTGETPEQAAVRLGKRSKPLASKTVTGLLDTLKAFLKWAADEESYVFTLPKKFDELFRARPEPSEKTLRILTPAELKAIFDHCRNPNNRRKNAMAEGERRMLFLLMAMNCGFYQSEISSLQKRHIFGLDGESPYTERIREKTRKRNTLLIKVRHYLWPETAKLLKRYLAGQNTAGEKGVDLALLNDHEQPLLNGRNDNIKSAWDRLVKVCGISSLDANGLRATFSSLKDTGATNIERLSNAGTSDLYLSHTGRRGVLNNYSQPDFDRLKLALFQWREELASARVFEAVDKQPVLPAKPKKPRKAKRQTAQKA